MKKMFLLPLLGLAAACTREITPKEETSSPLVSISISATKEALSKTFVESTGVVNWEDGDKIAVFDGKGKREFSIASHSGASAVFTGSISESATDLYAVYPFSAADSLNSDGSVTLTLPRSQVAGAKGVDPKAMLAVAKTTLPQASLSFKNVTALIKMDLQRNDISSVCFKDSAAVQLAGSAKVAFDGANTRIQTSADNYMVSLTPEGGCFAAGTYYIPVYPHEQSGGPVVELTADGKIAEKHSAGKLVLKRSSMANLGDVTSSLSWKDDARLSGNTVKILCLGNSFSEDACEGFLYEIFKAGGIEAVIGNGYVGSCDLSMHWSYASGNTAKYSYRKIVAGTRTVTASQTMKTMLQDEPWDYIVFQQGGGDQGFYSTYNPYLANLISYCRSNAAKTDFKVIFHYNWAAAKDCTNSKFAKYDNDQMKMYSMQVEAAKAADSEHNFDLVANTGDAIQSGRTTYLGDSWNRDGWHLNRTYGRYCASCLFYERITGKSSIGLGYHPAEISDLVAFVCQNAAHCAALYKYKYVDLSWIQNTDPAPGQDECILAKWLFDKTVSISAGHQASWTGSSIALGSQKQSNAPGLLGYMDANAEGSGRISFYQIDKTAMTGGKAGCCILDGTPGGQPSVRGQMGGDYWILETTGSETFSEGDHLYATFSIHPAKYGAKYWLLEYLDGQTWKPVTTKLTKTLGLGKNIDVDSFEYNIELSYNAIHSCTVDVVLTEQTPAFKIRLTCCSTYQVNDKYWTYPNNPSAFRIAGTEADGNLPVMKLKLH